MNLYFEPKSWVICENEEALLNIDPIPVNEPFLIYITVYIRDTG